MGPMRASVRGSACFPHPHLWRQEVSPRRPPSDDQGLLPQPLEGCGAPVNQLAPSQSQNTLNHPTHGRPRLKRRAPPSLRTVTPRRVQRALTQVEDMRDTDSQRGQHHHRPTSIAEQHPSHGKRGPQSGHNTLISGSHPRRGGFGHQKIEFSPSLPSRQVRPRRARGLLMGS